MIRLALLLFPLAVSAQVDSRWKLLPDSTVLAPLKDLRTAAAYRSTQNYRVKDAAWRIAQMGTQIQELLDAGKAKDKAIAAKNVAIEKGEAKSQVQDQELSAAKKKGTWTAIKTFLIGAAAGSVAITILK